MLSSALDRFLGILKMSINASSEAVQTLTTKTNNDVQSCISLSDVLVDSRDIWPVALRTGGGLFLCPLAPASCVSDISPVLAQRALFVSTRRFYPAAGAREPALRGGTAWGQVRQSSFFVYPSL